MSFIVTELTKLIKLFLSGLFGFILKYVMVKQVINGYQLIVTRFHLYYFN